MMGDTGPCGPCSELHVDLTPAGDTRGSLVNMGDARCIEIWNLVFIQFNANPDGSFSPLPAQHVDTGMGFERVSSIIQGTKNFTDFAHAKISNYETDIFRPLFDELGRMSGRSYGSTLPVTGSTGDTEQERADVAFRVIADHIRTLSFAIADGIQPGNSDRNYVLRRILRRAVRYGRSLGFREPFFYKLADVLARNMGDVFPEIRAKQKHVQDVIRVEEEAFNKTLDKGIALFEAAANGQSAAEKKGDTITGAFAFRLYDEQGFPLDLTELMAREKGLKVDVAGFNVLMEAQRARARAAQKKQIIELSQIETTTPTAFAGYDALEAEAKVLEVVTLKDKTAVILDRSVCYAEMGGQVGDTGLITGSGKAWAVTATQKSGNTFLHFVDSAASEELPAPGTPVHLSVDTQRRAAIQRHHTVTHLLHWALHEVVSKEATQKGSFVGPDKLTFDFNSAALSPTQVQDIERLVNERIVENATVSWREVPFSEIKGRPDIMQFFGEKYGDSVRVVQIGGRAHAFDGYSMELCAGTHSSATGEIGLFRIASESAIAAGVRRIEAAAGLNAYALAHADSERLKQLATKLSSPIGELEKRIDSLLSAQKDLEKQLDALRKKQAAAAATSLLAKARSIKDVPLITEEIPGATGDELQAIAEILKGQFKGVTVLAGAAAGQVALVAAVHPDFAGKAAAGKIIQSIAPLVGGKGGGRPDLARGAGKDASQLSAALVQVETLL